MAKLSDYRLKKITAAIRAGNFITVAVVASGAALSTHYEWMQKGKAELESQAGGNDPDPKAADYHKYYLAIERAKADCEAKVARAWVSHIPEDWRAARDFLRVRFPARWSVKDTLTVETPDIASVLANRLNRVYGPKVDEDDE